jgi:DNA (cytosine-5)-methyltransferase 1
MADASESRLSERSGITLAQSRTEPEFERCNGGFGNWRIEPDVGRVAHGVPKRVDRLKGLGNAVVPQVAYVFLKAIGDHLNAVEAT